VMWVYVYGVSVYSVRVCIVCGVCVCVCVETSSFERHGGPGESHKH